VSFRSRAGRVAGSRSRKFGKQEVLGMGEIAMVSVADHILSSLGYREGL